MFETLAKVPPDSRIGAGLIPLMIELNIARLSQFLPNIIEI